MSTEITTGLPSLPTPNRPGAAFTWIGISAGGAAIVLWLTNIVIFVLTVRDIIEHTVVFNAVLGCATMMSIIAIALSSQQKRQQDNADDHELLLAKLRTLESQVATDHQLLITKFDEAMGLMRKAIDQARWQGYAEAAADLASDRVIQLPRR